MRVSVYVCACVYNDSIIPWQGVREEFEMVLLRREMEWMVANVDSKLNYNDVLDGL